MPASPPITLPDTLHEWAKVQARRRGVTVGDFISDVLRMEQIRAQRDRVDAKLHEALDSGPAAAMTPQDWQDVRMAGENVRVSVPLAAVRAVD